MYNASEVELMAKAREILKNLQKHSTCFTVYCYPLKQKSNAKFSVSSAFKSVPKD